MRTFSHLSAPLRLHSGARALERLAAELDRAKVSRAVIVTGASLAQGPALEALRTALGPRVAGVWAGTRPHSPVPVVLEAAQALREAGADGVVALGGGSAIVTARAAAIALAEGDDLAALATRREASGKLHSPRLAAPKLPQFVVPTTPTTAAVKAGSAVFDPQAGERRALFDPATRAQAIALDPVALASAPASLMLDAGLNTLTLALEGILSRSVDPIAEGLLLQAVRLCEAALHPAPGDEARAALATAAVLAGRGTDHAGAGVATVLAHALGARHHLPHGALDAILLPPALRFNAEAAPGPLEAAARAFGVAGGQGLPGALAARFATLGIPSRLRDLGVPAEALAPAAAAALDDWFLAGNPRKVEDRTQLEAILAEVW